MACASSKGTAPAKDPLSGYDPGTGTVAALRDFGQIYYQMGLVNSGPPIGFVGSSAYFAARSPDSTLVVISLSIPNRGLTFSKVENGYEASYEVNLVVHNGPVSVARTRGVEKVRVGTFKETSRTDESIIFQHTFTVAPGTYTLSYGVRDAQPVPGVVGREGRAQAAITVPRLGPGTMSRPVIVYEATPRTDLGVSPDYLAAPRSSVAFGVDSVVPVYVEAYGKMGTVPVSFTLRSADKNNVVWSDTASLEPCGTFACRVVNVPTRNADIGVFNLVARQPGAADSTIMPMFIGFGSDLPVVSFDDMIGYLRYFTTTTRIRALRNAPPDKRGAVWADFIRQTDRSPETPQNEALQDYFVRIRDANTQFRGDGASQGWLSERGAVYVGLGQPDNVYEEQGYNGDIASKARVQWQIWEYRELQARIIFYDEYNSGQWKLIQSSASYFRTLLSRIIK